MARTKVDVVTKVVPARDADDEWVGLVNALYDLASRAERGEFHDGGGVRPDRFRAEILKTFDAEPRQPRGPCGYEYHAADCECGGSGGSR
jgi:hypothetical protein